MEPHRIPLDDIQAGAWVDIRPFRSMGMQQKRQKALVQGMDEYQNASFEAYVTGWSFEGRPNRVAFTELDESIATAILDRANEHYESLRPERSHLPMTLNRDAAEALAQALEGATNEDAEVQAMVTSIVNECRRFVEETEAGKA